MSRLERFVFAGILAAGLVVLATLGVRWYGADRYAAGHAAAVDERAQADSTAVLRRNEENIATAVRQGDINLKITEVKHEELAPVRERIVVERVRVGTAICGPAAAPDTEGAAGGDGPDPAGRLVRDDVDRDIKALKLAVEEHLATGRACQAFLQANGMAP